MKITDLADAWNALRNAALGRGVAPLASPALAAKVGAEYDAFRAYYESTGPGTDFAPTLAASDWIERYRALYTALKSEGHAPTADVLPPTVLEELKKTLGPALSALGGGFETLFILIAASIPLAAIAYAVTRGRK